MSSSRRKKTSLAEGKTSLWIDIAIRVLLAVGFAYVAGFYFMRAFAVLRQGGAHPGFEHMVDVFSILIMGFFAFFIAYLYAVRLPPVSQFAGILPAIIAVLGAFITWGLLLLHQREDLTVGVKIGADMLILAGNVFALYSLHYLGKSFSILPEGRALVTGGPYRYIRHPLYLAEAFATTGAMIHFLSPAAFALVAAQFLLQFARMYYEEKVLRETFPEFAKYASRTARLIPGIY